MITFAQLIGGVAAAGVAKGVTLSNFSVTNTTVKGISDGQGLAIEMFTTAMLVFTVLMMAAEKHRASVPLLTYVTLQQTARKRICGIRTPLTHTLLLQHVSGTRRYRPRPFRGPSRKCWVDGSGHESCANVRPVRRECVLPTVSNCASKSMGRTDGSSFYLQ